MVYNANNLSFFVAKTDKTTIERNQILFNVREGDRNSDRTITMKCVHMWGGGRWGE